MRGRKPKPTTVRALEGNPGHRPLNTHEPQLAAPTVDFDTPPAELFEDDRGAAEWRRLAPKLRTARQITDADRGALLALCQQWSRYQEATAKVQTLGMVVRTPSGYPIISPYLSIANKALAACTKLWAELGLTPSSRSRVTLVGQAEPDEFDAFLKKPLHLVK